MPTFDTPQPISVLVNLAVGDVTLIATDRFDTEVTVAAVDPANSLSVQAAQAVQVSYAPGQLTVKQSMPWYQSYGSSVPPALASITVELPVGSQLRGQTALGGYSSQGLLGECDLNVSNGEVRLDAIGQTLRVRGSNGDIAARQVGGDVEVKTSNGNILIGDVVTGIVKLTTSIGRIEVGIHPGTAANLDVRTRLGQVRNALKGIESPDGFADSVKIRARTNLQDIVIRPADQATQRHSPV